MKKLILLSLFFLNITFLLSQCRPFSETEFQSAKRRISLTGSGMNSFQTAMDIARMTCLTSNQARELATYLANDRDRIDFLKLAYTNILDKENFTDVMDAFRTLSSAFRLYHLTLGANEQTAPPAISNPNCTRSMDVTSFQNLSRQVSTATDDRTKAAIILNQIPSFCMSIQQISQMVSLIRDENIKFDILKRLAPFVIEPIGYERAGDILTPRLRQEFLNFLANPTSSNSMIGCELSDTELTQFVKSVENQSFDKDKVLHIKTHLVKRCLKSSQIITIVKLISFDESRLDIAKSLYENCIDKQNYFTINDALSFSTSRNQLNDFIKSKQ